ncbi:MULTISPECIES: TonB-dependent receptor [Shewanella]|uniref:TonB-dependent receptor n=1 Tax=Shewanella psychromarinicola TaxID=2487742 RepID=A0A3N4DSV7_9GAMM|nr:TonB-dependent receptor [Shewanella psychromarinicola]AZG33480.1 TonB-dependent receptor [Shewanella psychromarinicola]MCL1082358.1 TonB-dependent receptor [Shewanella psychromarinicola]RPA27827.1 TonB-dependent receptor [Shewanella psychromarinicola]
MGTKPTKIALLLSAVFSVATVNAIAAESTDTSPGSSAISMDETIVVIGRNLANPLNIAANVNVIDAADIQMSGVTNLTDLLRGQSGIQVSDNNSGSVFSMRGFSASQAANNTLILVDGRRLNNIDIAAPSIESIPLNLVERVEILTGSAGVLYGDQAVGGVINIITKAPTETSGGLQVSGGSFDTYEAKGDISGSINDAWRYFLAASYKESDNYRDNNDNETGSILGRVQYQTANEDFYVEVNYFDNDRKTPGALTLAQYEADPRQAAAFSEGEYSHEMSTALRSGYQYQLNNIWALGADLTYSDSLTTSVLFGGAGRIERELLSFSPKASANYHLDRGDLNFVAGIDVSKGEADFDTLYIQRNNEQQQSSAYVQASVPISPTLSYVVGGRYSEVTDDLYDQLLYPNRIEIDNDAHAFELGFNYRPSSENRFYVRANDNFRFAKVDEQAFTPLTVQGLDPQTGRSYEAGWDYTTATQTLKINAYQLELEDEIVYEGGRTDGPYGGGANVNADQSRRFGVSTAYDVQLSNDWLLGASYDYIDAEFTQGENDGKALSWVAEHSGKAYMSYDFADHWQAFVEGVYTGERYMEGDNSNIGDKLDHYVLTNLALNYAHAGWNGSLRVDNLLDEDYVGTGYYSAFGSGYYSGTGRSIRLTAGYRF